MNRNDGTKVTQVTSSDAITAAASGSRPPGSRYAPRNATNCSTMISGPGRRLGQRQPVHHLAAGQPAVGLHRLLGDEREHGVRAAEGHQGGAREEDAHLDEHRVAVGEQVRHQDRQQPHHDPADQHGQVAPGRGRGAVQRVVGDQRRRPAVVLGRAAAAPSPPGASGPAASRRRRRRGSPAGTAPRTPRAPRTRRGRSATAPGAAAPGHRPGPPPGRRSRAPPAPARGTSPRRGRCRPG